VAGRGNLLRWRHPTRGLLAPAEFLDVAETGDLIPPGRRALVESCRMAVTWLGVLGAAVPAVHVNVSGRQLEPGNFITDVRHALDRYQLPPSQPVLELTETSTGTASSSSVRETALSRVSSLGCRPTPT
jgi:EAL domain-containing protein (putative c-di-GMP-specific phosphodiesterase class I)